MSIVTFTFGSFGDIITILQLARSIQKSISDTESPCSECRSLIAYIDDYTRTLECVQEAIGGSSSSRTGSSILPGTLTVSAANAISGAIASGHLLMGDFQKKLDKYKQSFGGRGSGSWVLDMWRKVQWPTVREEAVGLQRGLAAQAQIINIILSLSASSGRHATPCIPPELSAGVYLTDMLDGRVLVPSQCCRTAEEFHDFLSFWFRKRAGRVFVECRDYTLSHQSCKKLLRSTSWREEVEPGMSVLMSALVIQDTRGRVSEDYPCPRCKSRSSYTTFGSTAEVECSHCGLVFEIKTDDCRFSEIQESSLDDATIPDITANKLSQSTARPVHLPSENDIHLLRHVMVEMKQRTDWDGPLNEQEIESILTKEDATSFFEQISALIKIPSEGQDAPLEIAMSLHQILKGYNSSSDADAGRLGPLGNSSGLLASSPVADASGWDGMEFFDFTSYTAMDEDIPKADLLPSTSVNPSPESCSEYVGHPGWPLDSAKITELDPPELRAWGQIEDGEALYVHGANSVFI